MENINPEDKSQETSLLNYSETESLMYKMRKDGTWLDSEGKHSNRYIEMIAHRAKLEAEIMDNSSKG